MKKNIDPKYIPTNLPKVKNWPLYAFRCFVKLLALTFFGVGSIVIAFFVFPFIRIFVHNNDKFKDVGHKVVSGILEWFVNVLMFLRVSKYSVSDLQALRNLKSCVIVANHPSLLDVVYIFAFVRNADCIVKAGLKRSVVGGMVSQLYISNNIDFDTLEKECVETLHAGNNLIIFPEGTRTPRNGINPYKKGAARIALAANVNVQPLHIGGNDKYGLGKYEPIVSCNPVEGYQYDFTVLPQLTMEKYKALPEAIAAKRLSDDMRAVIDSVK